ncbi:dolichyl-P-Man:Man(5)GlcNAc(2)-PP-dolichol alpha-1,3-mannosyltransferase [Schaereria dolodes]|nr:dolichyl-P-Man:Man(5)GlcNAc(2)-PP-dolichol alpha-1,3-mannosyltransferase [Schaereria dolodes]
MDLYRQGIEIAYNPKHTRFLSALLLSVDACLCAVIIWKIPYTEIDWQAYMQQVSQYLDGERDYTLIKGGTGPLVYPAAHVYIYSALYYLTDGGKNILLAQSLFALLYLGILSIVFGVYRMARAPPYIFPLLILSKRLHSLFMLRLFNDCFAVGALFVAIYAYQRRIWTVGTIAYSWGVGIKMSLLLALPGVCVVLEQALPFQRLVKSIILMVQLQCILAFPFLPKNASGYLARSFQFTRQFLFKWTVNWRFIGEETFLSPNFSTLLAAANLSLLALFVITRWKRPTGRSISQLVERSLTPIPVEMKHQIYLRITPTFMLTTILSSVATGMLCARSLHYQFYAYIAWSTPFLLWKAGLHPIFVYAIWAAQEWAWNIYPSTKSSSMVVVGCLATQVLGVWWGTRNEYDFEELKTSGSGAGANSQNTK